MNIQSLSIHNEIFNSLIDGLDRCLNICVDKIIETDMKKGTVTGTIQVEIDTKADENTGEVYYFPKFKTKAKVSIPLKGEMELLVSVNLKLMKRSGGGFLICDNQISVDDLIEAAREEDQSV